MIPFPNKKYNIIYADPPWRYKDNNCSGAAEQQYPTMTLEEIKSLPIQDIADKDCVLFIWGTYPMLREVLEVIKAWGFKYKSIAFQWVKLNKKSTGFFFGLGRWTRGNTEPCFIAIKGKPKRLDATISQLIVTPITRHSEKPDIVRDKIVKLIGDKPRIELFARRQLPDWDAWGNEV